MGLWANRESQPDHREQIEVEFDATPFVPDNVSTYQQVPEAVTSPEVTTVDVPDIVDQGTVKEEEDVAVEETPAEESTSMRMI